MSKADGEEIITIHIDTEAEIEAEADMTTMTVSLFHGLTQTPADNVKGTLSNQMDQDHPPKRIRKNSPHQSGQALPPQKDAFRNRITPSAPHQSRQALPSQEVTSDPVTSSAPYQSRQALSSQEGVTGDLVIPGWKDFYTRARAIHNKGPGREEPFDLFNKSHTMLNTIDETFKKIEKEEVYNFPKETLYEACEALSDALQTASKAMVDSDPPEVTQALKDLREAYDKAAESNTVEMRYIDVEPPCSPLSPLKPVDMPVDMPADSIKQISLARSWVKELITEIRNKSLGPRVLVVGKAGSGKSLGLPCL